MPALAALLAVPACHRASVQDAAVAGVPDTRAATRLVVLPDSAIAVVPGSTEARLAAFLGSDAPAPRLFRFDGPEFAPWQAKPDARTLRTMYAVAQILRAYPKSRVRLVGHTDNVGDPARNLTLSRERAARMQALLVQAGIRARRIEAVGHGAADPIADNATEAGRTRNRRIDLVVTAK